MTKDELLVTIQPEAVPEVLAGVLEELRQHVQATDAPDIEVGIKVHSVSHYHRIYFQRLHHCEQIGQVPTGMAETVSNLSTLPGDSKLRQILLKTEDRRGTIWLDVNQEIAGCVLLENPMGILESPPAR